MPGRRIDAERVNQLLAAGCTQTQVARRLAISKPAVCQIAKRMEAAK